MVDLKKGDIFFAKYPKLDEGRNYEYIEEYKNGWHYIKSSESDNAFSVEDNWFNLRFVKKINKVVEVFK